MNIERPGSPSATTVAPTSKRRSTSIETKRSRLASERPPKKGVASKNAFRSGELTAIDLIYSRSQRRQAGQARRDVSTINSCAGVSGCRSSRQTGLIIALKRLWGCRPLFDPITCLRLAPFGPPSMSALRSLSGHKRTYRGHRISVVNDPKRIRPWLYFSRAVF